MKLGLPLYGTALGALLLAPLALPVTAAPLTAHTLFIGRPAVTQAVTLRLHLPLRNRAELEQLVALQADPQSPIYHHFLSVAQFRARYGPSPATFARVAASLRARGFAVVSQTSQGLKIRGSAAGVERVFNTKLGVMRDAYGRSRVASMRAAVLPPDLAMAGATLSGLEAAPRVHTEARAVPQNRRSAYGGYYFTDLKEAYTYPAYGALNGKGATIGILMSSDVLDSDTQAQFDHEKFTQISGAPVPKLTHRTIEGGGGIGGDAFAEASIDVQTSLGSAPGANEILYNIPDLNDSTIQGGYTQIDEEDAVDVVSSSFGGCELGYTAAYSGGQDYTGILKAEHELFLQGNSQGITFLASSGDESGLACPNLNYFNGLPGAKFIPSVETPADDPNVTGVGGTNLQTTAPPNPQPSPEVLQSKYVLESEYGDPEYPYDPFGLGVNATGPYWGSGGGVSSVFAKPSYQKLVNTGSATMRTVPDISMQMGGCPGGTISCGAMDSFSIYYIQGTQYGYIGTSLSSPEFAGLLAIKVGATGSRLGNANPYIYLLAAKATDAQGQRYYHTNIPGYNGVVRVRYGQDPVYDTIVGVGTPNARVFLGVPTDPLAGVPQSPSNP